MSLFTVARLTSHPSPRSSLRKILAPITLHPRASSSSCPKTPRRGLHYTSTNEHPQFPCVDAHAVRESRLKTSFASSGKDSSESGPEPSYARPNPATYHVYRDPNPLPLVYYPTPLPSFEIAYETWGSLSPSKDNVILLHTGLSASSHAASTSSNPAPGWWEKFIGPGKALDTNQFFVICTNVIGGCYGSTGPSSIEEATGKPWATRFPIVSIFDMVNAQFRLLDHLGIGKVYASVGCSMGAMQSLAAGWLCPQRVGKVVSISGTARSSPSAVAMRFAQRSVLMADPNWNRGFYYDSVPPHTGMKLARQIATITYRSGPEWDLRFGRQVRSSPEQETNQGFPRTPALCPDFLIETYLDHQGESFCLKYDANSLLYISKAMDLFDLTLPALTALHLSPTVSSPTPALLPQPTKTSHSKSHPPPVNPPPHLSELAAGMARMQHIPTLVLGVQSDILFTVEQQREVADALRMGGNAGVSYYELGGVWGHDTFLIDVQNVGGAIRGFLS
ncbi:Alpha/Beta hydrolase protein [Crassisporium funariophilum]|nr:Alpha/Beta hydrolase protein [Crassisporium funariophilum]